MVVVVYGRRTQRMHCFFIFFRRSEKQLESESWVQDHVVVSAPRAKAHAVITAPKSTDRADEEVAIRPISNGMDVVAPAQGGSTKKRKGADSCGDDSNRGPAGTTGLKDTQAAGSC
ncbi:hypothetical protein NDU88_007051 [Pleurodeles waltl]|uniref:Uncharacterized protein n=1 Tax=Pleurodeles waltl TaxID=8319 RepID=A0AAV7TYR8_PLEWA|nr:hypothetical protein NDU88_007051 [Pleurodeles waltl]